MPLESTQQVDVDGNLLMKSTRTMEMEKAKKKQPLLYSACKFLAVDIVSLPSQKPR